MKEERVTIPSTGGVRLDGRLARRAPGRGAVICHPHPQLGGSMDNNVVVAARDAMADLGVTTLRFDFRGVGASTGAWDEGVGEAEDVAAAVRWLRDQAPGETHLVAYSFGAAVAVAALAQGLDVSSVSLISPPVDFMSLVEGSLPPVPTLVIAGDHDQYGRPASIDAWLATQRDVRDALVRVTLEAVDHFYWNGEDALKSALREFHS